MAKVEVGIEIGKAEALYRTAEATRTFRCVHCGSQTAIGDGGSDLLPYGCSTCWSKAHRALRVAGLGDC